MGRIVLALMLCGAIGCSPIFMETVPANYDVADNVPPRCTASNGWPVIDGLGAAFGIVFAGAAFSVDAPGTGLLNVFGAIIDVAAMAWGLGKAKECREARISYDRHVRQTQDVADARRPPPRATPVGYQPQLALTDIPEANLFAAALDVLTETGQGVDTTGGAGVITTKWLKGGGASKARYRYRIEIKPGSISVGTDCEIETFDGWKRCNATRPASHAVRSRALADKIIEAAKAAPEAVPDSKTPDAEPPSQPPPGPVIPE